MRSANEKRSYIMSKVGHKHTKPEKIVRQFLFKKGYRYRLHSKKLPGSPDIVLNKFRSVIFVNGCFWHQHSNCSKNLTPKTNLSFWKNKFEANIKRDKSNIDLLMKDGWNVIIVWECQLTLKKRDKTLKELIANLMSQLPL